MYALKKKPQINIIPITQENANPHHRKKNQQIRKKLLDETFGNERYIKTSYRFREGAQPQKNLSFDVRENNQIIATIQFWPVVVGKKRTPILLLGPIAVHPKKRGKGIGYALIKYALNQARKQNHICVILVGDRQYYKKAGFQKVPKDQIILPGPYDPDRLLYINLKPDAIKNIKGYALPPHRIKF